MAKRLPATAAMLSVAVLTGCAAASPTGVASVPTAHRSPTATPSRAPSSMADAGVVPTCDVIRGMFATANVAVSSVVDETANVQHAVARETLAYRILRHCTVSVPGRRTTSVVEIDGPGTVQLLSAFKALGIDCTDLPIARGY